MRLTTDVRCKKFLSVDNRSGEFYAVVKYMGICPVYFLPEMDRIFFGFFDASMICGVIFTGGLESGILDNKHTFAKRW